MPSALLVVDVQNAVVARLPDAAAFVARIDALVETARAAGVPVVWVQHADEDMPHGSDGWQLAVGLEPAADEHVVQKSHRSSFAGTGLGEALRGAGIDHLLLTGSQSAFCVDMAGKHALAEGFDVTLVSDGHANGDLPTDAGALSDALVTALVNRTWRTLRHPGRVVEVVPGDTLVWA